MCLYLGAQIFGRRTGSWDYLTFVFSSSNRTSDKISNDDSRSLDANIKLTLLLDVNYTVPVHTEVRLILESLL